MGFESDGTQVLSVWMALHCESQALGQQLALSPYVRSYANENGLVLQLPSVSYPVS